MTNQHTKGKIKPYAEAFPRASLKGVSTERLRRHYEEQGYIRGTVKPEGGGSFELHFTLDRVKMGYGDRYFILCSNCGQRVTYMMYFIPEDRKTAHFGCRHCFNVNYMVQQTTRSENDYHDYKMRQIGKKLDPDFELGDMYNFCPFKPKYMKQVTYDKLRNEFNRHRDEAHENWNKMLGVAIKEIAGRGTS